MYETEFIYKVAPRGGGKTKWLVEKALVEQAEGNQIYLLINDPIPNFGSIQYRKFMELFYTNFTRLATIHPIDKLETIPEGAVLLIDDLIKYDIIPSDLYKLRGKVKKIYIAVEGTIEKEPCKCKKDKEEIKVKDKYEQLSINFDDYDIDK